MESIQFFVRGMNCNRCKKNVENNLSRLPDIQNVKVELDKDLVTMTGNDIDLQKVKYVVESIGYRYEEIQK